MNNPVSQRSTINIDGFDTCVETADSSSGTVGDKKSPVFTYEHIKILGGKLMRRKLC